jgi:hypothetical protein
MGSALPLLVSLTHKRAEVHEGRAPLWGFEFTTKVAILQGDSAEIAPTGKIRSESVIITDEDEL